MLRRFSVITIVIFFSFSARGQLSCQSLFASSSLPSVATIQERYLKIINRLGGDAFLLNISPEINARRLVNSTHWKKAQEIMPANPWFFYGENVFNDWQQSLAWAHKLDPATSINLELLESIHRETSRGFYYRGYEKSRIDQDYRNGLLSKTERDSLFKKIYDGEIVYYSKVDHSKLGGVLRENPIDDYVYSGEKILVDGRRVANLWTINRMRKNPYFTVNEKSIVAVTPEFFEVTIHFVPPLK